MSHKGTNLSSVRVLMARPIAKRDEPRASSNHYSLVSSKYTTITTINLKNVTRFLTNGLLKMTAASDVTQITFINDGLKAWNLAPDQVKKSLTFTSSKEAIKYFLKMLPK